MAKSRKRGEQPITPVGLMGLGMMGRGIATCLLMHGLDVVAYNRTARRAKAARKQIQEHVNEVIRRKLVTKAAMRGWEKRLTITQSPADLAGCPYIIESILEDLSVKRSLYDRLEAVIPKKTIIASNTSGYPVSVLQEGRKHPERFLVVHWAEPAWITRYLEIVAGDKTLPRAKRMAMRLGRILDKQPSMANVDIRGFISNRMMYALIREACHLVESGVADVETVDRSFRNDIGTWATLAGPFRWMDLTGIGAYATVMGDLLPELSSQEDVPKIVLQAVKRGAKGIGNAKGFYKYTKPSSKKWEKAWLEFNYDIQKIANKYSKLVGGL
ncbi:MAG: 3-hydroxyacyl-CoA dehydrogenase family protein [Planctomycetes bacterium]|nr:3-hydroxyacyl-CoA dehydrogenase family protein [Planctomycetota bacterium]